jgi:hypothetical protein
MMSKYLSQHVSLHSRELLCGCLSISFEVQVNKIIEIAKINFSLHLQVFLFRNSLV